LSQTLSPQEMQIAQLAAEGLTNKEIGEKLSDRTGRFAPPPNFP
jgi:DNA-binding NarL/FixJ family response regulator